MTDLTTRLRCGAPTSVDISTHLKKYQALCDKAADEIVRLTAEVERLQRELSLWRPEATPTEEFDRAINQSSMRALKGIKP